MGPNNAVTRIDLLDKETYYKDAARASFSGLKVFSKCETLYEDMFVKRTYQEPERDYFIYGKLVDTMLTEDPKVLVDEFIRVERKVNPEDALKIENSIKECEAEIVEKQQKIDEKIQAKVDQLQSELTNMEADKDEGILTPAREKKYLKYVQELNDITMDRAAAADKTLTKGIASRRESIAEYQAQLDTIKLYGTKQQVTPSVWQNAEETVLAFRSHPFFSTMEWNAVTSQQIFDCSISGVPVKGKLDHLKLSPALTKLYAIYIAKQITLEELQTSIKNLNELDLWAVITDLKTCYDISKLEPYNAHYRGQLRFYQELVHQVLLIPRDRIKVQIFAADKVSSEFKKSELFTYPQEALDERWNDIVPWLNRWFHVMKTGEFVSDKARRLMQQECFTCSRCRFCPFSINPGEPVMVTGPRFGTGYAAPLAGELSTADALLDY